MDTNRIITGTPENILREYADIENGIIPPVERKFNGSRYIETFAELANFELRNECEAIMYTAKLNELGNKIHSAEAAGDKRKVQVYSEGFSDIVNKVKNAGKDLWRLIKKMLGKLIIFLEEQIAYALDKSKFTERIVLKLAYSISVLGGYGRKVGDKVYFALGTGSAGGMTLPMSINKTKVEWFDWSKLQAKGLVAREGKENHLNNQMDKLNADLDKMSKYQPGALYTDRTVPNEMRNMANKYSGTNNAGVLTIDEKDKTIALIKDKITEINSKLKGINVSPNKVDDLLNNDLFNVTLPGKFMACLTFWRSNVPLERNLTNLAKDYKFVANRYNDIMRMIKKGKFVDNLMDNGDKAPEFGNSLLSMVGDSPDVISGGLYEDINRMDTGGKTTPYLSEFIQGGTLLEVIDGLCENSKLLFDLKMFSNRVSYVLEDDDYVDQLTAMYNDANTLLFWTVIVMLNFRSMREIYFSYKRRVNELKNAPTEITDRYDKEVCTGVQTLISRSTKAAHSLLKYSSEIMMGYTKAAFHAAGVMEDLVDILKYSVDATSISPEKLKDLRTPSF